jgi:protein SCO1/2
MSASSESRKVPVFVLFAMALAVGTSAAYGHGDNHAKHANALTTGQQKVDVKLFDEALIDQDGQRVEFVSDVITDRIVVMNFIYTTCTTACPVASAIFQQVQGQLGPRLGKDVLMVSVSVDPVTDTPRRLKAYARKYKAKSGWTWLTGNKHAVTKVLEGLGAYAEDITTHPNMVLIGDVRRDVWTRLYGFTSPQQIAAQANHLLAARQP